LIGGFDELIAEGPVKFGPNWGVEYAPSVVRRASDNKLVVKTKFTDLSGTAIGFLVPGFA
jgi:hypothetical protein